MKPNYFFNILTFCTLGVLLIVVTISFGFRETDLESQPDNPIDNHTLLSLEKMDSAQYVHSATDSVLITKQNNN